MLWILGLHQTEVSVESTCGSTRDAGGGAVQTPVPSVIMAQVSEPVTPGSTRQEPCSRPIGKTDIGHSPNQKGSGKVPFTVTLMVLSHQSKTTTRQRQDKS